MVLCIRIILLRSNIYDETRTLIVGRWNAKQKIGRRIACAIGAGTNEAECPAVVRVVRIAENEALYVHPEFQVVSSGNFAEVVEVGVILILARLRPIRTEPQRKIAVDIDERQGAGNGILGNDVEPE